MNPAKNPPGRPPNERKQFYAKKFKLKGKQARNLQNSRMDELDKCPDDMARRLMLGVSEQFTPEEQAALGL